MDIICPVCNGNGCTYCDEIGTICVYCQESIAICSGECVVSEDELSETNIEEEDSKDIEEI